MRGALWLLWLAATALLWRAGALGTGAALAAGLLSVVVLVWPGAAHRRRRSHLQYVEMGKAPVGLR
ncbi:MAG: hypothetical protein J7549_15695 [Variovorax sp.]|nr:hypothetical protein [Variovorax sp.]